MAQPLQSFVTDLEAELDAFGLEATGGGLNEDHAFESDNDDTDDLVDDKTLTSSWSAKAIFGETFSPSQRDRLDHLSTAQNHSVFQLITVELHPQPLQEPQASSVTIFDDPLLGGSETLFNGNTLDMENVENENSNPEVEKFQLATNPFDQYDFDEDLSESNAEGDAFVNSLQPKKLDYDGSIASFSTSASTHSLNSATETKINIENETLRSPRIHPNRFASSASSSRTLDNRVFGDSSCWSDGPRLTPEGIREAYGGLYETHHTPSINLVNNNNNSNNNVQYISIYVQEYVIRPDASLQTVMNTIAIACKSTQLIFTRRQRSQGSITYPLIPGLTQSPASAAKILAKVSNVNEPPKHNDDVETDWDNVDVQVCVSKELKQRVILCQFFRKVILSNNGLSSAPPSTSRPLATNNNNVNNGNTFLSSLGGKNSANTSSPRILRIIRSLQRQLNSANLSLSNLYNIPPEFVCSGRSNNIVGNIISASDPSVSTSKTADDNNNCDNSANNEDVDVVVDRHFYIQLENVYREQMWNSLENEFEAMDQHHQQQLQETISLSKAMIPIFQQHQLSPLPTAQEVEFHERSDDRNDDADSKGGDSNESGVGMLSDSGKFLYRSRQVIVNEFLQFVHVNNNNSSNSSNNKFSSKLALTPKTDVSSVKDNFNNSGDTLDAAMRFVSTELSAEGVETFQDGMAKCLAIINSLFKYLRKACDRELTYRLQQHNAIIVKKVGRCQDHCRKLFHMITNAPQERLLETSPLNRSLITLFDGVTLVAEDSFSRFFSNNLSSATPLSSKGESSSKSPSTSSKAIISSALPTQTPEKKGGNKFFGLMSSATKLLSSSSASTPAKTLSGKETINGDCITTVVTPSSVLYTCGALISTLSLPGTIYITTTHLYLFAGLQLPGVAISVSTQREIYSLKELHSIALVTNSSMPFITSNSLQLNFYRGRKVLYLTPMTIKRNLLKTVLENIKVCFIDKQYTRQE